ncbi:putative glutamine amidotransferase-like protein [Paramyrothecium foliicola]|nr:putative glutamine amidotransferase-like protein [Paramyrothecium foliicola]
MGSAPPPLRLAILEADTPQPQTQEKFGGYGGVFTALLAASAGGLDALHKHVSITAHDVVHDPHSYPALEDVDALLLTGSRHTAFHDDQWIKDLVEYTRKAIETGRVRILGICFGHQIVARAMGAEVSKNPQGWEVAVTKFKLTPKGKEVLGLGDDKDEVVRLPWSSMSPFSAAHIQLQSIQQMHTDAVLTVPEGAELLGSNSACSIQGLYSQGRYLTVQGHPEFTDDIITEILTNRHKVGIFPDDVFNEAIGRAPIHHDGIAIGRAFLKFLHEG